MNICSLISCEQHISLFVAERFEPNVKKWKANDMKEILDSQFIIRAISISLNDWSREHQGCHLLQKQIFHHKFLLYVVKFVAV